MGMCISQLLVVVEVMGMEFSLWRIVGIRDSSVNTLEKKGVLTRKIFVQDGEFQRNQRTRGSKRSQSTKLLKGRLLHLRREWKTNGGSCLIWKAVQVTVNLMIPMERKCNPWMIVDPIVPIVRLLVRDRGVRRKRVHNPQRLNLLTVGSQRVVVPVSMQSVLLK